MISVEKNINLAKYTTLNIGGPAEYFGRAQSEDDLVELINFAKQNNLPVHVIGGGSNILLSDDGIPGLIIKNEISDFTYVETGEDVLVTAGAGLEWDAFVSRTVVSGWWGLENLSGIPGTVGATPIQNVGAYGVEVGELIEGVRVFDRNKETFRDLTNHECQFAYRDSFFKSDVGRNLIVCSVTYRLSKQPSPRLEYKDLVAKFPDQQVASPEEVREAVLQIRNGKFPDWSKVGTAGSFFKNPRISATESEALRSAYPDLPLFPQSDKTVKVALGYILDQVCGLRGYREGNVGLYDKQALVLVNYGDATAGEVVDFATRVAEKVFEKTKIKIEWEVTKFE